MTMKEWAKNEVELFKKSLNDADEFSSDYAKCCANSALKAFESLLEDGHSGMSIDITRNMLNDLIKGIPLTPITEKDFNGVEGHSENSVMVYQCPRMTSLFKYENSKGDVWYKDINRAAGLCDGEDTLFYNGIISRVVDEMFPIKLPYRGSNAPFIIYCREHKFYNTPGDYDTRFLYKIKKPDNTIIDIQRVFTERGNEIVEIDIDEYQSLLDKSENKSKNNSDGGNEND